MGAEFIALLSSALWASDTILVRQGARYAPVSIAPLMSFFVSVVFLWTIIYWFYDFSFLHSGAIVYFCISGLVQPGKSHAGLGKGFGRKLGGRRRRF